MAPASSKIVKKGIDADDARRRRETRSVALRKEKREEGLEKRRRGPADEPSSDAVGAAVTTIVGELSLDHLGDYCAAARSADAARQLEGVTCIRRLLSKESHPPVDAVLAADILPRLVQLLGESSDAKLQFEAAWAITNVASTDHTRAVVDAGAVTPLVAAAMSADPQLRDQCIWCLGNIAGDCARFRDCVLNAPGALSALLLNVQHPESMLLLRNATWALSNFCRGKPSPTPAVVAAVVPALAYLLSQSDAEVLQDAAWGLSYLTDGDEATIQAVLDAGVARRCVELMGMAEMNVATPALRVVGNFIAGSDGQTQAALNAGALAALVPLLGHARRNIKREACWAVSNVAAGTREQLSALMATPGLMASVVALLEKGRDVDWNVRKEAAWVVSNIATIGGEEHLQGLIALGALPPLVDVLGSTQDPRILCVVLDAAEAVLAMGTRLAGGAPGGSAVSEAFEEAGLLGALETVQESTNDDVYAKAVRIIEVYYGRDYDDDGGAGGDAAAPGVPASAPAAAFSFGLPPSAPALGFGAAAPAQQFAPFAALAAVAARANEGMIMSPVATQMCAPATTAAVPPPAQYVFNFGAFS